MKLFVAFSLGLLMTFSVEAAELKKIFDGTLLYCPEPGLADNSDQQIVIRSTIQNNDLILQACACVDGKWQDLSQLKHRSYISFNKLNVTETYFDFYLYVQKTNWTKAKKISLPLFAETGSAQISLDELKKIDISVVDINLASSRFTKASNNYSLTDDVSWGASRLFFKE